MTIPPLSEDLLALDGYATKAMATRVRDIPDAINLAFGEPAFGPTPGARALIEEHDLNWEAFLKSSKSYEQNRGMPELRAAIADYYARRYGLKVDPAREILITHGGVEAITMAALAVTNPGDVISVTDPTYMLYSRALKTLGRVPNALTRPIGGDEYAAMLNGDGKEFDKSIGRALIVNSPENPSGYVMSEADSNALSAASERHGFWLIHDEVYDSMAFARPHLPVRAADGLGERSILINSFSKKYGVPGLRIGWLCAPAPVIDLAAKLHDFMYLGVNILSERFGLRMISDAAADPWMDDIAAMLGERAKKLQDVLSPNKGFKWPRAPQGSMFAFPDVSELAASLPPRYRDHSRGAGAGVADWLLDTHKLAVIPGHVYGASGANHIRMILCSDGDTYADAIVAFLGLKDPDR